MSKSNFKTNVEWLSNPRIAISLGVMALIAAVVVYFFWDKIRSAIADAKASSKEKELSSTYGSTTPGLNFSEMASTIYSAFRGIGTDEAQVESVLSKLRNNADYSALRSAYRSVNSSNWYKTLDSRLASEGTAREKRRWRGILDAAGIDIYTF